MSDHYDFENNKHMSMLIRKNWKKRKGKKITCCKSIVPGNVTKADKRASCWTMEGYYRNRNKILLAKCEIRNIFHGRDI